ncbi:protein adenylyltransferase SelO family protein [Sorangium sp. So ce176]
MFAGNEVPAGATPIAQACAGHQLGGFSPSLGDGRALLLDEVIDRHGRRHPATAPHRSVFWQDP